MAEFYFDTEVFLRGDEWSGPYKTLQDHVLNCMVVVCKDTNIDCQNNCKKPIEEINDFVKRKQDLYVKKGVEYCKHECWEAKNLTECSDRCVKEYGSLYRDFKQALIERLKSTRAKQ